MTITIEQVYEYFDNVPSYRVGEQLEELISNFPNSFSKEIDSQIEDLECENQDLEDRIEELDNIIDEAIYELGKDKDDLQEKIDNAIHELERK